MAYLNEVTLIGNVGKKPRIYKTKDGKKIAGFSLATTKKWKQDGKTQDKTEWHRVKAFGKKAEVIEQYVEQGEPLFIRGELRTGSFQDENGTEWRVSEVILKQFEFLTARKDRANEAAASAGDQEEEPPVEEAPFDADEAASLTAA